MTPREILRLRWTRRCCHSVRAQRDRPTRLSPIAAVLATGAKGERRTAGRGPWRRSALATRRLANNLLHLRAGQPELPGDGRRLHPGLERRSNDLRLPRREGTARALAVSPPSPASSPILNAPAREAHPYSGGRAAAPPRCPPEAVRRAGGRRGGPRHPFLGLRGARTEDASGQRWKPCRKCCAMVRAILPGLSRDSEFSACVWVPTRRRARLPPPRGGPGRSVLECAPQRPSGRICPRPRAARGFQEGGSCRKHRLCGPPRAPSHTPDRTTRAAAAMTRSWREPTGAAKRAGTCAASLGELRLTPPIA